MRHIKNGFTLIETVIYIGLIAIILPAIVLMLLNVQKSQSNVYSRLLIENINALILSQFEKELLNASSISISTSTLDSNSSILIYKDNDGNARQIGFANDTIEMSSVSYEIGRIQYIDNTSHWLTPEQVDVDILRIEPVYNSESLLTGTNILLTLSALTAESIPDQSLTLETQTTIYVQPTTIEE